MLACYCIIDLGASKSYTTIENHFNVHNTASVQRFGMVVCIKGST